EAVPDLQLLRVIRAKIAADFGIAPAFVIPLSRESFPKTTSGKIQRTALRKALGAGAFDALLKRIDLEEQNENTLPVWHYHLGWQRRRCGGLAPVERSTSLILLEKHFGDGLGGTLCQRLPSGELIRVEQGEAFARLDRHHYQLNPVEPAGYEQLAASL